MAKMLFSAYAVLLLISCVSSVVDVQCNAKGNVRMVYMPGEEPPYDTW